MMIRKKPKPPFRCSTGCRVRRESASFRQLSNRRVRSPVARRDEIEQEAQIMQAQEAQPENLLLVDEMADVRAAERRARRAVAALVERPRVAGEAGVPEVEAPLPRERAAGARGARRQDAVEHVDAARDHLEHALRVADAHEVARLLRRAGAARRRDVASNIGVALLADAEAADRVAVEVERDELLDRAAAELGVEAALRDPEAELAAARAAASRWRSAQSVVRRTASSSSARGTPAGGQMSRHIAMSEPSRAWIARRELRREALRRCRRRPSGT